MRFSRVTFWCISATALLFLASLAIPRTASKSNRAQTVVVDCFTGKIQVDPSNGVEPHSQTRWICTDDYVQWDPNRHDFKATFDPSDCPFIDKCLTPYGPNSNPQVKDLEAAYGTDVHTFKYSISVDGGPSHDPYVVGGGGRNPPPGASHK